MNANADLLADYLGEAKEYLERINGHLLGFDGGITPSAEQINDLFRAAHSLKGLSACFGFERTNALTHQLESLLAKVQRGEAVLSEVIVRTMFDAVDMIETLTAEIAAGGTEQSTTDILLRRLDEHCTGKGAASPSGVAGSAVNELRPAGVAAPKKSAGEETETVRVKMERLDRLINMTGELVIARSRFSLACRAMQGLPRVRDLESGLREITAVLGEIAASGTAAAATASGALPVAARVQQLVSDLQALPGVAKELDLATYDLDGIVSGLHKSVLEVRLVSLESTWKRLQRVIRDTTESVGKTVSTDFSGGDTQLDKKVADELVNPLVHLIRNAIDHGLEDAGRRKAAGKPEVGRLSIRAQQRGSSVVLEIADDGAGIDPERVKRKAIETGVITAEEAGAMSVPELQRLIFRPGFSTAKTVTAVSGRGMGMDIVESTLKKLRGQLLLHSEVGKGTTFTIHLPPSVSILACLLLRVRGTVFAAPLSEVQEIVSLPPEGAPTVHGKRVLLVRGQPIPLVDLTDVYTFARSSGSPEACKHAVVFQGAHASCAVAVDGLVGKEDLVMKPLCAELANVQGLAGMAVRGDGCVSLILDTVAFTQQAAGGSGR